MSIIKGDKMTEEEFKKIYGKEPTRLELQQAQAYSPRLVLTDKERKNLVGKFHDPTKYNRSSL